MLQDLTIEEKGQQLMTGCYLKSAWIFLAFAAASVTMPYADAATPRDAMGPIDCNTLAESLPHPRWLSLPDSRLVVNPFFGQYGAHDAGSGGSVDGIFPLDLAYYVGAGPVRLPAFCFVQSAGAPVDRGFVAGLRLSLSDAAQWQTLDVTAKFGNESAQVTPTGDFGAIVRMVTVDLDKTPCLCVETPPGAPAFDMKVNSGDQPADTMLKQSERFGCSTGSISAATGWHGTKTFKVILYALGKNRSTTFTRVQFFGLPEPHPAEITWMPHEISSSAEIGHDGGKVYSAVTMPDADTVSERVHIGPGQPRDLALAGQFMGTAHWDSVDNTLVLNGDGFSAYLALNRRAEWLGVRSTQMDWAVGEGDAHPAGSGVWRMAVNGLKPGDDLIVAARFVTWAVPHTGSTGDTARKQASVIAFRQAVDRQKAAWDRRLALVPRPLDFAPQSVDAKGITAADVRRSYYRAWVFFFADSLPPMPEHGFPYPQVCAGKPSLWTEGATHSEETSTWDSVYAMQALALVDPGTAWHAAVGIMSQINSDGYLDGEALPAVYGQTFWLLYQQTGDIGKLRSAYPALKRYLSWKIDNPRWVYPNRTKPAPSPNAMKDQEFASFNIVDTGYAVKIAGALGILEDLVFWRQRIQNEIANYQHWFWPDPGGRVYRVYSSDTDRGDPDSAWSLQGLQIGRGLMPPEDSAALVALYKKRADPGLPFLVPGRTRFGDLEPITLGLFDHGQVKDTVQLTDAILRDVTRAGEFSEDYTDDNPPLPAGVRPSAFGARLMTDSVFWHNGMVLDQGFPVLLGMPGAAGVDNVPVQGVPINVHFGAQAQGSTLIPVTLQGSGLQKLHLPDGFQRVAGPGGQERWQGTIQVGERLKL